MHWECEVIEVVRYLPYCQVGTSGRKVIIIGEAAQILVILNANC
jgi:hypothetical protein